MKLIDLAVLLGSPRWSKDYFSATCWACDVDAWEVPEGWFMDVEPRRGIVTLMQVLPGFKQEVDMIALCVAQDVARVKREHIVGITPVMLSGRQENRIFPLEWKDGGFSFYGGGLLRWMKLTLRPSGLWCDACAADSCPDTGTRHVGRDA